VGRCISACILVSVFSKCIHAHAAKIQTQSSEAPSPLTHTRKKNAPSSIFCRSMWEENVGFLFLTASLFTIVRNAVVLNGFKKMFGSCQQKFFFVCVTHHAALDSCICACMHTKILILVHTFIPSFFTSSCAYRIGGSQVFIFSH
jgi:hypothetical protein